MSTIFYLSRTILFFRFEKMYCKMGGESSELKLSREEKNWNLAMKPKNIFSHTHGNFFSTFKWNDVSNYFIYFFFFQLMIRFRPVGGVIEKVYGFCRRKCRYGGSIEWRENRFKETATPTSGLLFIGQLGRAQSKQKKLVEGGNVNFLTSHKILRKSLPYLADAMDIMDVVQRLKKGNNQLLRWMSNRQFRLLFFLLSFGCIVQNGDFSQELIHRSRKMTSFLYTQLSMFSTVTRGDDTDANVSVEFTRSLPISTVETFFPFFFFLRF